jgi:putative effector of murein hydrolase LrgA (UPF0299 family)
MQLALIVVSVVLGVTVVFAVAGYLIDLTARHFEQSRESKRNIE